MSNRAEENKELTAEAKEEIKEQIKKIEDGIVAKIEKYNDEIKLAEGEEAKLRTLQNRAYIVSEQFRKASRLKNVADLTTLESELNELDTSIQSGLNETLSAKNAALVSLQTLYRDHVEYLSKVANGLKQRFEEQEANKPVIVETLKNERISRSDNVKV
jgi:hypothetical protein